LEKYLNASQDDPVLTAELEFATRWAGLLEHRMHSHKEELKDVAASLGMEANPELLCGAMLDHSVTILIEIWEDGEKLAKWYKGPAGQEFRQIATVHPGPTPNLAPIMSEQTSSNGA
jgi:hypothetical protein